MIGIPAIVNASVRTTAQQLTAMPQMRSTLNGYFKPLNFSEVVKRTVNFQTVEVRIPTTARGTWQPFSDEQLSIRPEGERSWRWFLCHASTDLVLLTDDIVTKDGVEYRVMGKGNYEDQAFVEYHLVNAYDVKGLR